MIKSRFVKHKLLRRMLLLDQPLDILTPEEADTARQRDLKWNLFFNSGDVIFFMSGISIISATTILPLFVSKLSDSPVPLAILAMLAQGAFYLPQLLTANFIEQLDYKKPVIVNLGLFTERLPAVLFFTAPLLALWSPTGALIAFLLLYAWFSFGGGVIAPAWQDFIARCFPVETRGRFLGTNMFVGTLIGAGAATITAVVLDDISFPYNFTLIFAVAGACLFLSWVFLAQAKEPIEPGREEGLTIREYLADLPRLVGLDINFRHFLIARTVLAFGEMGSGYLTVAALQTWDIPDGRVATFAMVALIGETSGSFILGWLADRYGHNLSLQLASGAAALAFLGAWLAPDPSWFFGVFFLHGFFFGGRIVSGLMVVLEFAPPEKRPTYIGITSTLAGIGSMAAPLIGGGLAYLGFEYAFIGSLIMAGVAMLLLRFWVDEPRFVEKQA